eukprot:GHVN01071051.1.p1 GENE.GHVN01071051.1~~GHVN01071051.1.p1  ORF type:complete len:592 (+),score=96.79 GHVN01071051.1:134-1909(+)
MSNRGGFQGGGGGGARYRVKLKGWANQSGGRPGRQQGQAGDDGTGGDEQIIRRRELEKKFKIEVLNTAPPSVSMSEGGNLTRITPTSHHSTHTRRGYLYNVRQSSGLVAYSDKTVNRSGVDLYFIDSLRSEFRVTVLARPYFYVDLREEVEGNDVGDIETLRLSVINLLQRLLLQARGMQDGDRATITEASKIDLDSQGHLARPQTHTDLEPTHFIDATADVVWKSRLFLKLEFESLEDLRVIRYELNRQIEENKKTIERLKEYRHQLMGQITGGSALTLAFSHAVSEATGKDPLLLINALYEADMPHVSRVCIDREIRCGKWYDVIQADLYEVNLTELDEISQTAVAPLRVLAWDIETSKAPLRFPDPETDCIMCISYMVDGQGYLIVNRQWFSEDINDFEYTPNKAMHGPFKIFNVTDERSTILKFFHHIAELRPQILVTFNGDTFDFDYTYKRAEKWHISMQDEIGFPVGASAKKTTSRFGQMSKEYQGHIAVHMDCLKWVERDSYLPCGSRGLKAVTRAKLRYEPKELDPELMCTYASERPRELAEYSVSDAVATYFLYTQYIHRFTFALCSIIPLPPDDVLRKGSG